MVFRVLPVLADTKKLLVDVFSIQHPLVLPHPLQDSRNRNEYRGGETYSAPVR